MRFSRSEPLPNRYRFVVSVYPNKIGYNFSFENNYLEIEEDKISSLKDLIE